MAARTTAPDDIQQALDGVRRKLELAAAGEVEVTPSTRQSVHKALDSMKRSLEKQKQRSFCLRASTKATGASLPEKLQQALGQYVMVDRGHEFGVTCYRHVRGGFAVLWEGGDWWVMEEAELLAAQRSSSDAKPQALAYVSTDEKDRVPAKGWQAPGDWYQGGWFGRYGDLPGRWFGEDGDYDLPIEVVETPLSGSPSAANSPTSPFARSVESLKLAFDGAAELQEKHWPVVKSVTKTKALAAHSLAKEKGGECFEFMNRPDRDAIIRETIRRRGWYGGFEQCLVGVTSRPQKRNIKQLGALAWGTIAAAEDDGRLEAALASVQASRKKIGYVGSPVLLKDETIRNNLQSLLTNLTREFDVTVGVPNSLLAEGTGAHVLDMSTSAADAFDVVLVAPGGPGAQAEASKFAPCAVLLCFCNSKDNERGSPEWLTKMAGSIGMIDLLDMDLADVKSKVAKAATPKSRDIYEDELRKADQRCQELQAEHKKALTEMEELHAKRLDESEASMRDLDLAKRQAEAETLRHVGSLAAKHRELDERTQRLAEAEAAVQSSQAAKELAENEHKRISQDYKDRILALEEEIGRLKHEAEAAAQSSQTANELIEAESSQAYKVRIVDLEEEIEKLQHRLLIQSEQATSREQELTTFQSMQLAELNQQAEAEQRRSAESYKNHIQELESEFTKLRELLADQQEQRASGDDSRFTDLESHYAKQLEELAKAAEDHSQRAAQFEEHTIWQQSQLEDLHQQLLRQQEQADAAKKSDADGYENRIGMLEQEIGKLQELLADQSAQGASEDDPRVQELANQLDEVGKEAESHYQRAAQLEEHSLQQQAHIDELHRQLAEQQQVDAENRGRQGASEDDPQLQELANQLDKVGKDAESHYQRAAQLEEHSLQQQAHIDELHQQLAQQQQQVDAENRGRLENYQAQIGALEQEIERLQRALADQIEPRDDPRLQELETLCAQRVDEAAKAVEEHSQRAAQLEDHTIQQRAQIEELQQQVAQLQQQAQEDLHKGPTVDELTNLVAQTEFWQQQAASKEVALEKALAEIEALKKARNSPSPMKTQQITSVTRLSAGLPVYPSRAMVKTAVAPKRSDPSSDCPSCGAAFPVDSNFCKMCGQARPKFRPSEVQAPTIKSLSSRPPSSVPTLDGRPIYEPGVGRPALY